MTKNTLVHTEKIKYTLEDSPSDRPRKESPFDRSSSKERTETPSTRDNKNIFLLDDNNDQVKPDFPTNRFSQNFESEEIAVQEKVEEIKFFEDENPIIESYTETFEVEEKESGVLELFNFDDDEVIESQSFSFETEKKSLRNQKKSTFL